MISCKHYNCLTVREQNRVMCFIHLYIFEEHTVYKLISTVRFHLPTMSVSKFFQNVDVT